MHWDTKPLEPVSEITQNSWTSIFAKTANADTKAYTIVKVPKTKL